MSPNVFWRGNNSPAGASPLRGAVKRGDRPEKGRGVIFGGTGTRIEEERQAKRQSEKKAYLAKDCP